MSIEQYIKERIETLRTEKVGLVTRNYVEYMCIMNAILELQAVLSKIEELEK